MIILDTTTRSIQATLGGAITTNQLPIVASYLDYNAGVLFSPLANNTVTNNTTAVTVVAAPTGTNIRNVKYIQVQNADTVAQIVTIIYNDNGTTRNMIVVTLNPGDALTYEDGRGWQVITNTGALKYLGLISGQVVSGFIGNAAVVSGSVAPGALSSIHFQSGTINSGNAYNWLLNPGFDFCTKLDQVNPNTINGSGLVDAPGPDYWMGGIASGGSLIYQRWDQISSGYSSGITNRFYSQWEHGSSGVKSLIYQLLDCADTQSLANTVVTFQAQMKTTATFSGSLFRMGLLTIQSGGAGFIASGLYLDTPPNPLVSGYAVATSGTDPTWGSGVVLLGPAITCQLTPNWQVFSVPLISASGSLNLIPAFWANNALTSGFLLNITETGLYAD